MRTLTPPAPVSPTLTNLAAAALRDGKTAFLQSHRDRCGYLRITFAPAEASAAMVISALFTLPESREWHHVDVRIGTMELRRDADLAVRRAFAELADGIATVGIAQLFRPRSSDVDVATRRL